MASVQRSQQSSRHGSSLVAGEGVPDQFLPGLRVLVVDDDRTSLKILEKMLKKCMYTVTTCNRAEAALSLLREKKGGFDVVISDVHLPHMDGFKLLQLVGLEMGLPVVVISADGRTSTVMRGVKHGACDYLIKPVRIEELKNIWQHVIRKNQNREHEQSGSRHKQVEESVEITSSVIEFSDSSQKGHKKRKEAKDEDDNKQANEDPATSKKPRVVWSAELHRQFVNAVEQLGVDKAVPKRILELMNVPALTRENVASHLQKFRLYLKRVNRVPQKAQNQEAFCGSFGGPMELKGQPTPLPNIINMQAFAASGRIAQQPFGALHAELLGCHSSSLVMPPMDESTLVQAAVNGSQGRPMESVANFQPLIKSQFHLPEQFAQTNVSVSDNPSGYSSWQHPFEEAVPSNGIGSLNSHVDNILEQLEQQQAPVPFNTQPPCFLGSTSSGSFLGKSNFESSFGNHNPGISSFNCNSVVDYNMLSSPSIGMRNISEHDLKSVGLIGGYSLPISESHAASCSIPCESTTGLQSWPVHNSIQDIIDSNPGIQLGADFVPNACEISYGLQDGVLSNQGIHTSMTVVNPSILSTPSFANEGDQGIGCLGNEHVMKEVVNLDFRGNANVGMPVLQQHFSSNDLMNVFSK